VEGGGYKVTSPFHDRKKKRKVRPVVLDGIEKEVMLDYRKIAGAFLDITWTRSLSRQQAWQSTKRLALHLEIWWHVVAQVTPT
jgi:hypothetical protein